MARSEDLWKLALKARRKHHARFEKAEREGRLEEEYRLYNAELHKKWDGILEFAPLPPPYPGTLRLISPPRKPKKGVTAAARPRRGASPSPKKRKKNPE